MTTDISSWAAAGQGTGNGAGDSVIYYRKPNGWITWGDSLSGTKLHDFVYRRFEPMMQFGRINSPEREVRAFGAKGSPQTLEFREAARANRFQELYLWEEILTHPDGPAQFPVEQVVAYGWYRPENCPVPDAYFPQLVGVKIRELNCPERCGRRPFVEVDGLGGITSLRQHLRIMHKWDQANLLAYGDRVGIDFNKADVEAISMQEVDYQQPSRKAKAERKPVAEVETIG